MTEKKKNAQSEGKISPFADMEREVLDFWDHGDIFVKSVEKEAREGEYVFYDGPPFATGMPHYGHIVASIMKDAVPRYWTMRGYRVERRWGWDCHGLPIENLAEQELGFRDKTDIEKHGVEKFNDYCASIVLRYAEEWKKIIKRIGRWVDMENDYKTMNPGYMESIWWVFRSLWDKGLIYRGHKPMHICPRCGTTLSNFEVTQGYQDIKDISCTVKFRVKQASLHSHEILRRFAPQDDTGVFMLAWTTTPWTLIGNVALAIGKEIEYVRIRYKSYHGATVANFKPGYYIVAKEILWKNLNSNGIISDFISAVIGGKDKVLDDLKKSYRYSKSSHCQAMDYFFKEYGEKYGFEVIAGNGLVGIEYEPLFDYFAKDKNLENRKNGWKVYAGDFVTTEEGTGIVHMAPAFGEDDMELGKQHNLPFVQHVDTNGRFTETVADWPGAEVKPKDDPKATDKKIVEWLDKNDKLFASEEYEHSYPHCWRCDTPLLNYAAESWFVEVTKIKNKLLASNKDVNWVPAHIRDGRFGKWLETARDWAISRNRYWGAPLSVWECDGCDNREVIGGIDELNAKAGLAAKIIFVRHGRSLKNEKWVFSSKNDGYPLTKTGREHARNAAEQLSDLKVDMVLSSPVQRARETAAIISKKIGVEFTLADELHEISSGKWEGIKKDNPAIAAERKEYKSGSYGEVYEKKRGQTGESWKNVEERISGFVASLARKHRGKTIVLVTHQACTMYGLRAIRSLSLDETVRLFYSPEGRSYARPIITHVNAETGRQVNLHKQYVDSVTWPCGKCDGIMRRIPEVLDCWFESGSMPYAQDHYPFENKVKFERNFPAQFIAEGVDQTRGWFYTLLVLSTALFGKSSFRNVIVNGIVLAEDGQKMSKRLKNYPDPAELFERYSVDAMRYYLLSSPVLTAENLNFSEDGVKEVLRKVEMVLWNVYKFYGMYVGRTPGGRREDAGRTPGGRHILDKWIIARLDQLIGEVTENMDAYVIPKAVRPIGEFINDLSTWYLRRSRDRFKGDDEKDKLAALKTTRYVLMQLSKVMAPFMPFIAERLWQQVTGYGFGNKDKSVHLESWPSAGKIDQGVLNKMDHTRKIIELGLAKRDEAGIKVRQPLNSLKTAPYQPTDDYIELIKAEVNVKNVICEPGNGDTSVELDTKLTPKLKQEGIKRELVRLINNMRKQAGLTIADRIKIYWHTDDKEVKETVGAYAEDIKKDTLADDIEENKSHKAGLGKDVKVNGVAIWLWIEKTR